MAKTKAAEAIDEVEVVVFAEAEAMMQKASTDLVETTIGTREHLAQLKATYGELVVNGIEDMAGYKIVVEGISKLKSIRTGIEKRRKALTEPALKFQRDLKAVADEITAEIVPLEQRLAEEKARIDDAKETARRAEFQRRVTLLTENAWTLAGGFYVCGALQIHPDQVGTMDQAQLEFYVNEGQKEIQRREAEAKRKADEEARRKAEEDRLQKEREAFEKEKAEFQAWKAKQEAELNAQKEGIEKAYETVVQPEQPLPIQDAGKRLQERSKRLIDLGMKHEVDGFVLGKKKILHTALLDMPDAEFEQCHADVKAYITTPSPTAPQRTAPVQPAQAAPAQQADPTWHQEQTDTVAFQMGFNNFRMLLIEQLGSPEPMKRADLIRWATDVQPRP